MNKHESISGLILAGGRGTRMGQVDKGLQPFRGKTMVDHVLERLGAQVGSVAINANQNLDTYAALGVPVWPDELPGFAGPLAGMAVGMRHCGTPYLLTAPCDSPFLPPDLAARLLAALEAQDADLAFAVVPGTRPASAAASRVLPGEGETPAGAVALPDGGRPAHGWLVQGPEGGRGAVRGWGCLSQHQYAGRTAGARCAARAAPGRRDELPVRLRSGRAAGEGRPAHHPQLRAAGRRRRAGGATCGPGRVLARDIVSTIDVPAHDNSAMDGYALRGEDVPLEGEARFAVIGTAYAGIPAGLVPGPGECVRIMTGGVMPAGCDSVVPQEFVMEDGAHAIVLRAGTIKPGDNRRFAGEDLKAGSPALRAGRVIRPADLGLIASLGVAEVPVRRRLRVAFFSTGDELRSIGQPLAPGSVYDSNRYTIYGMLQRLGCDIVDMGVVRDDPAALEEALRSACENADAIITSGGVSVGAADYTKQIMARLGDVTFWKIGMRPGRPLAFGRIASNGHSAFLFGLPGNPVAVMVSFYFFARDALLRMMGADAPLPLLRARCVASIRKKPGRTEYQRGILAHGADGAPEVRITGSQGSGILRSMSEANCMVVLHDGQGNVEAGEMVDVLMFEGLI
ncbi:gephyrin-like molybdotransferase Glp [Massilia sp. Se16.2.3]|uniref:molybdopterin molybdotransferase MoeA n=1 Tax=Massilia sp. Se16.2.3 TaxID=2709303 RepID=UPI001E48AEEE|nr:gephyrin-like molybdotransferase Glp [Massilia sp. Se16.2.3]